MSEYKHITSLGLTPEPLYGYDEARYVVDAEMLEKILSEGVLVFSHIKGYHKPAYWGPKENGQFDDTHTGLVVGIKEIREVPTWNEFSDAVKAVCSKESK